MNSKLIDYINHHCSFSEEYFNIFHKQLPQGKCFCPFHDNTHTPAAKLYRDPSGYEVLHCFAEQRNYGTYALLRKYNPDRIEEIRSTIILPDVETSSAPKSFKIRQIDRTKSIDEIITTILQ